MKRAILPVIALGLATSTNAQDKDPLRLSPSSAWAVNYGDESCELTRKFGADEQEVTLVFRADGPGGRFFISAFGQPLDIAQPMARIFVNLGDIEQLDPGFIAINNASGIPGILGVVLLSVGPVPNPRITVPWVGLPGVLAVDPANEQRMDYLALQSVLKRDIVLETGSMGKPLAALRACVNESMTHWGIDLEKHRTLMRRATPRSDPRTWIRPKDYLGEGRSIGFINFRLIVDEKGKVAECTILGPTQLGEFPETACSRLARRAKFDPALDAFDRPVRSYYISSVVLVNSGR